MAHTVKKTAKTRRSASAERAVLYRGIRIAPMVGTRSPLARALREALHARIGQQHGEVSRA